jgi:hypothetical protein
MPSLPFVPRKVDININIDRVDYDFEGDSIDEIHQSFEQFTYSFCSYIMLHRLTSTEIMELKKILDGVKEKDDQFMANVQEAFKEGILGNDGKTIDPDAYLGTFSQILFKYLREYYHNHEIVYCEPELMTDSSKEKGIDYFEIIGDETDFSSLHFIVWEIKGTDRKVSSRTGEIYEQHLKRSYRLLRGLQTQLDNKFSREGRTSLMKFSSHLMDFWIKDSSQKKIGGCVVFDTSQHSDEVFTTFHTKFPSLADCTCRKVVLVKVPSFEILRTKVFELLWSQIT